MIFMSASILEAGKDCAGKLGDWQRPRIFGQASVSGFRAGMAVSVSVYTTSWSSRGLLEVTRHVQNRFDVSRAEPRVDGDSSGRAEREDRVVGSGLSGVEIHAARQWNG